MSNENAIVSLLGRASSLHTQMTRFALSLSVHSDLRVKEALGHYVVNLVINV
jgi:hypothetical protein